MFSDVVNQIVDIVSELVLVLVGIEIWKAKPKGLTCKIVSVLLIKEELFIKNLILFLFLLFLFLLF